MIDPTEGELHEQLETAYPTPAPDEIGSAWSLVASTARRRKGGAGTLLRAAALVVLVGGAFAVGFAVGRSGNAAPGKRTVADRSPINAPAPFPVRPPELLPASAVGGS